MELTKEKNQKAITTSYVRFKVTICLYLCPNNRARSLSMLLVDNGKKTVIMIIRLNVVLRRTVCKDFD